MPKSTTIKTSGLELSHVKTCKDPLGHPAADVWSYTRANPHAILYLYVDFNKYGSIKQTLKMVENFFPPLAVDLIVIGTTIVDAKITGSAVIE